MPPLPADFIYSRGCKPNLRKILDTTNRQSHVSEYALFQDNGADKMGRANVFSFEP